MEKTLFEYELLDFGDQKRLEKFGETIVERPAPQAIWEPENKKVWESATAVCEREGKNNTWTKNSAFPDPWQIKFKNLTLELRASSQHQVGIFPEQLDNWEWIEDKIKAAKRPLNILNLFAYTGVATLAASSAADNVKVCHVDGAKSAINWAKKNAELSGLQDNPIRWICDDVIKFVTREVKRGRKYDGIILDPPAFGRGPGGEWKINRDLPILLDLLSQLISDKPLFVILSCHAQDYLAQDLLDILETNFNFEIKDKEAFDLSIPAATKEDFYLSICGRIASV